MSEIPFQVALSMNNSAGELFGNRHLGVSVQRWTNLDNFGDAVTLVDYMFEEMAFTGGNTVIVDLSALPASAETELYQLALTLFCVTGEHTKRVALVGASQEFRSHPGFAQIARRAETLEVTVVTSDSFATAMAMLNETAHQVNGAVLPYEAPAGAENTYAGSVSVWPAHTAVVLTLAGDDANLEAIEHMLDKTLHSVRENKALALLVDTTASAPIHDLERLNLVLNKALPPLLAAGLQNFLHVRPNGDKLIRVPNAPDISSIFRAAGVNYERYYSLADASMRLDNLAGHVANSTSPSSALH